MSKSNPNRLPDFFNVNQEGTDYGYEAIQDFFLSWTFRCAVENTKTINEVLHHYSKRAVFYLIYGKFSKTAANESEIYVYDLNKDVDIDSFKVISVKTYRQTGQVDLIAEIEFEYKNNHRKVILNIENKYYTTTSKDQLEKSKYGINTFFKSYPNEDRINLLIYCDHLNITREIVNLCVDQNYKLLTIPHIQDFMGIDGKHLTGNYLFDEYWFHYYPI